jgi:DDE domain
LASDHLAAPGADVGAPAPPGRQAGAALRNNGFSFTGNRGFESCSLQWRVCEPPVPDISYETVRRWVLKFGPAIARRLRQRRPRPSDRWHLDEMVVRIDGKRTYLWRAVDECVLLNSAPILRIPLPRSREGNEECQIIFHCHCLMALAG